MEVPKYQANSLPEYDVFISHANKDKENLIEELYKSLKKLGVKIFYDKEILEKKDFYNKVVVVNENDKLVLQEKKIFPIQYLCIVLTAVVLIIRILAGFIKKR